LYSTTYQRLIIICLGANDGLLKHLQQEVLFFKISIPYATHYMRKLSKSDCLYQGGRILVANEGK
jgi:lysophospholipase L1-like esterase